MAEYLLNPEWFAIYGIILSVILAFVTYFYQKTVDRKYEIHSLRRDIYARYFAALAEKFHLQTIQVQDDKELRREVSIKEANALGEMRKCYMQMLVMSSDTVCRKVARFQGIVGQNADGRDNEAFAEAFSELLASIRSEGFGRSRLRSSEIDKIVKSNI